MPFFTTKVSFRVLMDKTFKKHSTKRSRELAKVEVVEVAPPPIASPPQEEVVKVDLNDAYHDPSILDIRRNSVYGLNDFIVEINKVTAIASPAASKILFAPSPSPTIVVDPPAKIVEFSPVRKVSDDLIITPPQTPPPVTAAVVPCPSSAYVLDAPMPKRESLELVVSSVSTVAASVLTPSMPPAPRVMTLDDLKFIKVLNVGSSGQVYMVKDKVTKERRALKIIPNAGLVAGQIAGILEEQAVLRKTAGAPYLLTLDASFYDTKNFYLVMPLYPTDLESEIIRCDKFPKARARFYFVEGYLALTYLHTEGIIHRDIKPANMLLSRDGHVVLGDFGLAKDFFTKPTLAERMFQPFWPYARGDDVGLPTTRRRSGNDPELLFTLFARCGTALHLSPELLRGDWYSFGVDYWALAVCLYMMVTGRPPFDTESEEFEDLRHEILNTEVSFRPEDGVDAPTEDFLTQLLQKDPEDRLRLTELEEHPFFEGVNWPLMEKKLVPAPWIPPTDPRHVMHEKPAEFIPGVPLDDGVGPYPEFEYTSEAVRTGVVRTEDVIEDEDGPEQGDGREEPTGQEVKLPLSRIAAFCQRVFGSQMWRKDLEPSSSGLPTSASLSSTIDLPPTPSVYSCSASSMRCDGPALDRPWAPSTPAVHGSGVLSRLRLWFERLWVPKTRDVPDFAGRFDLLA
ncbi:hypothetical protein LshimejAT787_0600670 [Lyophyllum shimeji]|uniref:non-specific serine/threonine protein kinase n=1 Tax=Lyophyllum shimeji TaxID=47721 RepID=A0A9P3UPE3_LYOSH|nr:hypothetical protein LshimejAT787_0600670 [Lyophyllum shimeji]